MSDVSGPLRVVSADDACRFAKCLYISSVAFRRAFACSKVDTVGSSVGIRSWGSAP